MSLFFRKKRKKSWQRSKAFKRSNAFSARRKKSVGRILKITIVAIAVFFVVYFLFFSQFFLIKEIKVDGNKSVSSDNIKGVVAKEMSDAIFYFIPGNNLLFSKNEKAIFAIEEKFSEIKAVEIKKVFPNVLEIKIIEKEPIIIWCRSGDCYYIDNKGVVFRRADNNPETEKGERIVKIIEEKVIAEEKKIAGEEEIKSFSLNEEETEDNNNQNDEIKDMENKEDKIISSLLKIDEKVSDEDFINFALNIDREIKQKTQLKIKFYKTKGTKTRELIAYTDKNIRLYFNALEKADLQVKYLQDFLLKGIDKDKIDNLEYIYCKSGKKIFYK